MEYRARAKSGWLSDCIACLDFGLDLVPYRGPESVSDFEGQGIECCRIEMDGGDLRENADASLSLLHDRVVHALVHGRLTETTIPRSLLAETSLARLGLSSA